MGFHYPYNASSAHRWLNCHGFKPLAATIPNKPANLAMATGTAAHYLGEWAMRNGYSTQVDEALIGARVRIDTHGDAVAIVAGPDTPCRASYAGIGWVDNATKATKEFPVVIEVDESMVRAVAAYMSIVNSILAKYPGQSTRHIEMNFELAKDMGGMSDMTIAVPGKLIVLDYKNGHNPVSATDNAQLAMYGVGALHKFGGAETINEVVMGIVQPNVPGPALATWTQSIDQMIEWRDRFELARRRCEQARVDIEAGNPADPHLTTGSHCKWCPAMVICPAKQREVLALVNRSLNDLSPPTATPAPSSLDDARLLWFAEHGGSIIEFVNKCHEYMTEQAVTHGKQWDGYKLVESQTRRRLRDKEGLTKAFKAEGLMDAFEPKLKSLSKLEKIFGKEKMVPLWEKPKGALQLVPDTDKRQSSNSTMLASLPALPEQK